jgi:hypothetical protein
MEPLNTYNWSTDLDLSWVWLYDGKERMRVHLGFLEAFGLCDHHDDGSFTLNKPIGFKHFGSEFRIHLL